MEKTVSLDGKLDHITPKSKGDLYTSKNIQAFHAKVNRSLGNINILRRADKNNLPIKAVCQTANPLRPLGLCIVGW